MITDYQIALIIISIVGTIISISLYVYFVYIPAARAENQIDIINQTGSEVIDVVNDRIEDIKETTSETLNSICDALHNLICTYNNFPFYGGCTSNAAGLGSDAYPNFCNEYLPLDPNCVCSAYN